MRESLQRRSFGRVITDATSGHVTYRTSVLRLNPWELAQAGYRESLLEQHLDRRCAVALVHVGWPVIVTTHKSRNHYKKKTVEKPSRHLRPLEPTFAHAELRFAPKYVGRCFCSCHAPLFCWVQTATLLSTCSGADLDKACPHGRQSFRARGCHKPRFGTGAPLAMPMHCADHVILPTVLQHFTP